MEEKGMLTPAFIAPNSGRRYYDNHNVARILQIEKFKAMGLDPEEVSEYFIRGGDVSDLSLIHISSFADMDMFDNVPFFVSEYPTGEVNSSGSLTVTVMLSADLTTPLLFMKRCV